MQFRPALLVVALAVGSLPSAAAPDAKSLPRPIVFEPNVGQTDPEVKYLARGQGFMLFITDTAAVFKVSGSEGSQHGLQLRWLDARKPETSRGEEPLPASINYFRGSDPSKWITDVRPFRRVRLASVYPGIDLVFHGETGSLEYDFVVAPGADPSQIALAFDAGTRANLARNGDLVVHTGAGALRQHRPLVYQMFGGKRHLVTGRFVLARNVVRFSLGAYDRSLPLVIDPVLSYSTLLGGSDYDSGNSVAVDGSGRAYVTGHTYSTDFPIKGGRQSTIRTAPDAFVTKFWTTGGGLIYSTYIGGDSTDYPTGIAVDRYGNAYIAGFSYSTDFPTTTGAFQRNNMGSADGFVAKLNPNGNGLVYSTYVGGISYDEFSAIALDNRHRVYVAGIAFESFPLVNPVDAAASTYEAVVTRLNPTGSALEYSTFLGGTRRDFGSGIAVDSSYRAYVTGSTESTDFPTTSGAFQRTFQGGVAHRSDPALDAFVARLSADGRSFSYSTYLGGSNNEDGLAITVDDQNRAYVTGRTLSDNFPTTAGAFRRTRSGSDDVFVTRLSAAGGSTSYSTYIGGSNVESGRSIAVDSSYRAWVAGTTYSSNFPTKNRLQGFGGGAGLVGDAFVLKLWATGGGFFFSTYLGGAQHDSANEVRLDANGNGYVTGSTGSTGFPTTSGAFRRSLRGGGDAFVTKIQP